jgi:hypothetical protein
MYVKLGLATTHNIVISDYMAKHGFQQTAQVTSFKVIAHLLTGANLL